MEKINNKLIINSYFIFARKRLERCAAAMEVATMRGVERIQRRSNSPKPSSALPMPILVMQTSSEPELVGENAELFNINNELLDILPVTE